MRGSNSPNTRAVDVKSTDPLRQLSDDEIWAAISYLEEDLHDTPLNANVALTILIVGVVIALFTLVLHVASS